MRIIDANGNRAREALRVLEESARFLIEDKRIAGQFKQIRHELSHALIALPGLVHHRDTPGDVGTGITIDTEQQRGSVTDVVQAAAARLSEALRVIEEYAKTQHHLPQAGELARLTEKARYRGYDLAQRLTRALGSGQGIQWHLCLLLTESLCIHHDWRSVLKQALDYGADAVQVREKEMDDGDLIAHTREVIAITAGRAAVIVNDRADIALLSGADGVHLGQSDLNPTDVRKLAGDTLTIGVSTSNLDHAKRARDEGADYCGVGPMFPTTTKHKPHLAGPAYLRDYLSWDVLPHLAIGGIRLGNINELTDMGCQGIAVSSTICSATNPGAITAGLIRAIAPPPIVTTHKD